MKIRYYLSCFLLALAFMQPATAKEVSDFRCQVRLSEHDDDILRYWGALGNLLHNGSSLSACISDSDVTVNKTAQGYDFIIQKPSLIFYKAQGLEDKKRFTLSFSHPLKIETQLKDGRIYIQSQHVMENYALNGSHVKRADISGNFSVDGIYDLHLQSYVDANWQMDNLDADIYDYEGRLKINLSAQLKNKKTAKAVGEKFDISDESELLNISLKARDFVDGQTVSDVLAKLDIAKLDVSQEYTQMTLPQQKLCVVGGLSDKSYDCLWLNNTERLKITALAQDLFLEFYNMPVDISQVKTEQMSARLELVQKEGKLGGSHHFTLSAADYQWKDQSVNSSIGVIGALLPQDFSYSLGFINLDKASLKAVDSLYGIPLTQIPIIVQLNMQTTGGSRLDFLGRALFDEKTELKIMDIFYPRPYIFNNLGNSVVEATLMVEGQGQIIEAIAPFLPIGKNMINLFLGLYAQKTKDTPPKHFYKLTIEDGKPKVNGRGLGLKF